MATEDYWRSRRIFKTTSAGNTHDEDLMEVDAISLKGQGKEKSGKGKKGGKKGKESHSEKVVQKRQQNAHDSMVNVEIVENMDTKHLIVGTSRRTHLKVTGKGTGKSKSKVTEINESDNSKQVDEGCPSSNTSAPQSKSISSEHDWMRR